MIIIFRICIYIVMSFMCINTYAMNLLLPYSILVRPLYDAKKRYQFFVMAEGGIGNAKAFNCNNEETNTLRIFECTQNALTMLEGFSPLCPQSQLLAQLNTNDDGVRGHFNVCGDLTLDFAGNIAFRYFFHKTWSLNLYLPYYVMSLNDVVWQDLTLHETDADERVHALLTDNLFERVHELGCGLSLQGWRRHGPGDLTAMIEWYNDFPQAKEFLRNVRINGRFGISFPTGLRRDIDKIFTIPFGYDGAFSLPFAGGLELTFVPGICIGFDVFLTQIFGRTATERIKTAVDQTSLLLLQKAEVFRDSGLKQEFSLWVGTKDLPLGLTTLIGYQYDKQGRSDLCLSSNAFSNKIANTAPFLREWTSHQIILRADYDFGVLLPPDACVLPRLSLYARLPFNGKQSALVNTIGISLALDF